MIGLWQFAHRTLHGNLCLVVFSVGSYHSRLWCPSTKLISSLWKIAAHWKGAAASWLVRYDLNTWNEHQGKIILLKSDIGNQMASKYRAESGTLYNDIACYLAAFDVKADTWLCHNGNSPHSRLETFRSVRVCGKVLVSSIHWFLVWIRRLLVAGSWLLRVRRVLPR